MTRRFDHVPVVLMPRPHPPIRIRRLRWSKRRALASIFAAAGLIWLGAMVAVKWALS